MDSCIFEGRVRHSRKEPVQHRFTYRLFLMYVDLSELPTLFDRYWLWSAKRAALARFRRSDHVGPESVPLDEAVRDLVEARTGNRPRGRIRLLTHLSYFGYCFNPVSFYYCYDESDNDIETIVVEVNNTPWREQYCYVLPATMSRRAGKTLRFTADKQMHVSPFMDMDMDYDWVFDNPAHRLNIYMANSKEGKRFFDVAMSLTRREIGSFSLARVLVAYPMMTLRVTTAIYWQALRLLLKRCPAYMHPAKRASSVITR